MSKLAVVGFQLAYRVIELVAVSAILAMMGRTAAPTAVSPRDITPRQRYLVRKPGGAHANANEFADAEADPGADARAGAGGDAFGDFSPASAAAAATGSAGGGASRGSGVNLPLQIRATPSGSPARQPLLNDFSGTTSLRLSTLLLQTAQQQSTPAAADAGAPLAVVL